jgi:hypothetical protein
MTLKERGRLAVIAVAISIGIVTVELFAAQLLAPFF